MKTTLLTVKDIEQIVQAVGINNLMSMLINALEEGFRTYDPGCIHVPTRSGFTYDVPHTGLLEWMPIMDRGRTATIKVVGYHPSNLIHHELPTIISSISIYDLSTGHLTGIMDGTFTTALRTGAASGLASRYLAAPNAETVGLIGAGAQAVTQLHALSTILNIKRAIVYDLEPMISRTFADRIAFTGIQVEVVERARLADLVAQSDILVTATSNDIGSGPVFDDGKTHPWLHINAVGSDFPGKTEVPVSLLKRAFVTPDFPEQALKEGECQQLASDSIGPALYEIIRNPAAYDRYKQELTVFDSTGWAVEDAIVADLMFDFAREYGLGTEIELENLSSDPLNPYAFVH